MNFGELFSDLQREFPVRAPGSGELTRVVELMKEITAAHHGPPLETETVSFYSYSTSVNIFAVISLCLLLLGLAIPGAGFFGQFLLCLLFFGEIVRPTLSRLKSEHSTNVVCHIPARSKEAQKIYLTTALSTDKLVDAPAGIAKEWAAWLLSVLFLLPLLLQFFNFALRWTACLYLELLPLALITWLQFSKGNSAAGNSLNNPALLMDLASLLTKSRPSTTAVTIILTGARSLNSTIQKIEREMKKNELAYLINLVELPGQKIGVASCEGVIIPLQSDPFLLELLADTAREKNIPAAPLRCHECTEIYPLLLLRRKALTLANPLLDTSNRDLRELLIGLIRKIDHESGGRLV